MMILKPIVHETIWGGEKLTPVSGTDCKKIGHLYSCMEADGQSNEIMNGSWKGRRFSEYFADVKADYGLDGYVQFPLIIALVEASDNLSIQVHPDDETAYKLEQAPFGKNESWYFLQAPQSGSIIGGCKAADKETMRQAVVKGEADRVIDHIPVKKGDYVYIKGGTLHAMTTGSLVYEIEENAEYTYRIYDYDRLDRDGRKRPLQIEQALESLRLDLKPVVKSYGGKEIGERMYDTMLIGHTDSYTNQSDMLECITILQGEVCEGTCIARAGQTLILEPGDTIRGSIKGIMARPKAMHGGR